MGTYFVKPLHCNNCENWIKKTAGNKKQSWCSTYNVPAVRALCKCIAEHGKKLIPKDDYEIMMENCF